MCVHVCSAHREVLRLRYDDYVRCVSEQHLIRVKALLEAPGANEPIMAVTNIPLSMPELLVQVGTYCVRTKVMVADVILLRILRKIKLLTF